MSNIQPPSQTQFQLPSFKNYKIPKLTRASSPPLPDLRNDEEFNDLLMEAAAAEVVPASKKELIACPDRSRAHERNRSGCTLFHSYSTASVEQRQILMKESVLSEEEREKRREEVRDNLERKIAAIRKEKEILDAATTKYAETATAMRQSIDSHLYDHINY